MIIALRFCKRAFLLMAVSYLLAVLLLHLIGILGVFHTFSKAAYPSSSIFSAAPRAVQTEPRLIKLVEKSLQSRMANSSVTQNYDLILNPVIHECQAASSRKLLLLALVMISPDRFEKRDLIRQTWAARSLLDPHDLRVLFVLGSGPTSNDSGAIEAEFLKHNDIAAVADLVDSYHNLTRKVMMSFRWAVENCPNARFIMRVNDDVMVNTPMLVRYLKSLPRLTNTWMGNWYDYQFPIRDQGSKYCVSRADYSGDKYAAYMEGSMYILTSDLAESVYELSTKVDWPPFSVWLEDIYVGMLCIYLKASSFNLNAYFSAHGQDEANKDQVMTRSIESLFFVYMKTMADSWNEIWNLFMPKKENLKQK
jgi:beta-1,3-galactosyltransferase 1